MKSRDRLSLKLGTNIYIAGRYGIVGPYRIDNPDWLVALQAYDNSHWIVNYWPVTKLSFRVLGDTR